MCLSAEDCFRAAVHGERQGKNKACHKQRPPGDLGESSESRSGFRQWSFFYTFFQACCLLIGRSSKSHIYVTHFPKVQCVTAYDVKQGDFQADMN